MSSKYILSKRTQAVKDAAAKANDKDPNNETIVKTIFKLIETVSRDGKTYL